MLKDHIITKNLNGTKSHTKISKLLLEPEELRIAGCGSNVFSFSCGQGNDVLFL